MGAHPTCQYFSFMRFLYLENVRVQEEKPEIVASKFGDRSSYACIAATNATEFCVGLPAKQGIARNGTLTVVNNFQFLNADLTDEQIEQAISKTVFCKVNHSGKSIEYELNKSDEFTRNITPHEVAVQLFKNSYGKPNMDVYFVERIFAPLVF